MTAEQYAAIELGGTKCICLVGSDLNNIAGRLEVFTGEPEQTLLELANFLLAHGPIKSIGIGTFGPVDINTQSDTYGCIQTTPKKGWRGINLISYFNKHLNCPVFLNTDVNAAALAEYHLGAGKNLSNFIYVTIGTGIGASAFINGTPVQGLCHPEMGHISLPRISGDENYKSCCNYHADCAEGFASGSAIFKRWGASLDKLPQNSPAWDFQARYLAAFFHTLTLVYAPRRIIIGGGVSSELLLARVRPLLLDKLNGYMAGLNSSAIMEAYITLPALKQNAGPFGSFLLNFEHVH